MARTDDAPKAATGAVAKSQLADLSDERRADRAEKAKLLAVTIDALEDRAVAAERLNKLLVVALIVLLALALGRELGVDIPGVGKINTGAVQVGTP